MTRSRPYPSITCPSPGPSSSPALFRYQFSPPFRPQRCPLRSPQLVPSSSFTALRPPLWFTGMSKRLPGLVIEVESLPEFLAKSDEDILQHVRSVLLHRAYAVQRAQLAKCDGVQFSPTKDSCVFAAKGRALLHVRFAQLKA